jgi:hypothetical protein
VKVEQVVQAANRSFQMTGFEAYFTLRRADKLVTIRRYRLETLAAVF